MAQEHGTMLRRGSGGGVQVSVAKNFDAPIKLLFPRAAAPGVEKPFSMLGLGDIVIPGVFVALLLRYDALNGFRTKYFYRLLDPQYSLESRVDTGL